VERFLAQPAEVRARAFEQAAAKHGWPPGSVEKDLWVCVMLRELFVLPACGEHLTFKGGTSLSKAWGLIDRFSEDIDLTIDRDALGFGGDQAPERARSGKERQRRLDALRQACLDSIARQIEPALRARLQALVRKEPWSLTADSQDPDGQTLLFAYPRAAGAGAPTYVKPVVKLEFGARSDPWPFESRQVTSLVAQAFPSLFLAKACTVRALSPERTFWEKVLLLHEERHRPAGKTRRPRMARHFHDVWRLIDAGIADKAVADASLFEQVVEHRRVYFRQNWVDYTTMKRGTVEMTPKPGQLAEWRADYAAMQRDMFLTPPPPFEEVLAAVAAFQSRFNGA
jgi:predicted nucleotidyltransferase component of viral defense system